LSNLKLDFSRGEVLAQKYEVVDLLDESPLGLTYRTKHLSSGKYVRLTLLRPKVAGHDQKEQVLEAFNNAKNHTQTNLIKVGELGDHEGVAYYTMEDFEGQTLRELIQEHKVEGRQFSLKESAQITIQMLEALEALHEQGVFVRALRPEYVLVNVRYTGPRKQNFVAQVKLVGACFWDLVPTGTLAEDEFTRGEAQYLAPELKSFEPEPSTRSDAYSVAVMFYEMLTGTAPVGTYQLPTMLRPELPRAVNGLVEVALAMSPEDRYPSAADFSANLRNVIADLSTNDTELPRKALISPMGWGIILLLTGALAVIGYQLFGRGGVDAIEKEAEQADTILRNSTKEQHKVVGADEIKAVLAKHPKGMIYIPAGPFIQGRMNKDPDAISAEPLTRKVDQPGFVIDAFEYPNQVNAVPMSNVKFHDAERLCQEQGKRLCSADEWEKACKGPNNLIYAYGDFYDTAYCPEGAGHKSAIGDCKGSWAGGPFDMSGNFAEWTSSAPAGGSDRRIVKGVSSLPHKGRRCAFGRDESTAFTDTTMSFRCCRDVDAPPAEDKGTDAAK